MTSYYPAGDGPVVVQGQPVSAYDASKLDTDPTVVYDDGKTSSSSKPQPQGGCRDAVWAVLFYAHLGMMGYLTLVYGPQVANTAYEQYGGGGGNDGDGGEQRALEEQAGGNEGYYDGFSSQDISIDPKALIVLTGISGVLGCGISSLAMGFMMKHAETLIKTALIFNVIVFGVMALGSLLTGMLPAALMGLVMCGFAAYYTYAVWRRVPVSFDCIILSRIVRDSYIVLPVRSC